MCLALALALAGCAPASALAPSVSAPVPSPSVTVSAPSASPSATASVKPTPTPSVAATPPAKQLTEWTAGPFELPLEGSIGFATVATTLTKAAGQPGGKLAAGEPFTIVTDEGDTWIVTSGKKGGRVTASSMMVNLPDLIPSIVYHDVNADASIFRSSGIDLPGVTGKQLYKTWGPNQKLGHAEWYMPVLWPMATKIMAAQKKALAAGETLIMYQTFRPYSAQSKVVASLTELSKNNETVHAGIEGAGWKIGNFIATTLSNHQLGVAIDVTLGKITGRKVVEGRDNLYTEISTDEYKMQTQMHELSKAAAPSSSKLTKESKRLRSYCIDSGMSPIGSEWWHFDDLDAKKKSAPGSNGRYELQLP